MTRLVELLAYLLTSVPLDEEYGVEAVEYAMLGAMLVAIIVAINPQFSGGLAGAFNAITSSIAGAVSN